jgi:Flp pilus assembly protein TadG
MSGLFHRFGKDRRGATAVEFSLVVLPLMMLMIGVLEFGRAFWTREALQQTATASARCMGLLATGCAKAGQYDAATTQSFVQANLQGWGVSVPTSGIQLNRAAACAGVSGFSSVSISTTFNTAIPAPGTSAGAPIVLTGSACFPNNS